MRNPVTTLLHKNISVPQIAGYILSNIAGLSIIIAAMMFYSDIRKAISPEDGMIRDTSYMILSHKVSTFGAKSDPFSNEELESLKAQPWVAEIAPLTSAAFNVSASADLGGQQFSTAMFFESLPVRFLDNPPESFRYSPGDTEIPVILPRDYLSLYNFGFASSRGLPAMSEAMAGSLPLTVTLEGSRGRSVMKARVVGFTNRVNSILVPEEFLEYANRSLAGQLSPVSAERIILRTDSPGDPAIKPYLQERDLQSSADDGESHSLTYFLGILTGVIATIGAIITLLSLGILLLSLSLVLQKNRREISGLLMLGYSIRQVSATYIRLTAAANAVCLAAAAAIAYTAATFWREPLASLGIAPSSTAVPFIAGAAIAVLLTLRGSVSVIRNVRKQF